MFRNSEPIQLHFRIKRDLTNIQIFGNGLKELRVFSSGIWSTFDSSWHVLVGRWAIVVTTELCLIRIQLGLTAGYQHGYFSIPHYKIKSMTNAELDKIVFMLEQ